MVVKRFSYYLCLPVLITMLSFPATANAFGLGDAIQLLTGWLQVFEERISAYKTLAKQSLVNAQMVSVATLRSFSATARTQIMQGRNFLVAETVQRYGQQGITPCYQISAADAIGNHTEALNKTIAEKSAVIASTDPGDETQRLGNQIRLATSQYCSEDAQELKLCNGGNGTLASANADFSQLVLSKTKSNSERDAGYDYLDNILPQKRPVRCDTPECLAEAHDFRFSSIVDSFARLSFTTMIEARAEIKD